MKRLARLGISATTNEVRLGVLIGSTISAIAGVLVLLRFSGRRRAARPA
jgi:Na+/H+ antiporter NhaA